MSQRNESLLNLLAENRLKEVVECSVKKAINDALDGNCDNLENVMDIEWQEGAVCFANGKQWFITNDIELGEVVSESRSYLSFSGVVNPLDNDFQLNTIKKGDYIESSELDTENKYNDAVEVFGLFGFMECTSYIGLFEFMLIDCNGEACSCSRSYPEAKRKLTYPQLMAIGELKRLEIEKSAPKIAPDLTPDLANKQEVKMQKNKPVVAQVMIDLTERMEMGIKTYGEALRANNGRDALQDAYEEALDLACYLKQAMIERDSKEVK